MKEIVVCEMTNGEIMVDSAKKTIKAIKGFFSMPAVQMSLTLAFVMMLVCVGAHADILSYDAATGALTWDFSTVVSGLVACLSICAGASFIIFTIIAGIAFGKKMLKG